LQQIIKAPPFFLEWIWPSEDGFFILSTTTMIQRSSDTVSIVDIWDSRMNPDTLKKRVSE